MTDNKELQEKDLINLSGGLSEEETQFHTLMVCDYGVCGQKTEWVGNFLDKVFECPICHHMTYKGVKLIPQQ